MTPDLEDQIVITIETEATNISSISFLCATPAKSSRWRTRELISIALSNSRMRGSILKGIIRPYVLVAVSEIQEIGRKHPGRDEQAYDCVLRIKYRAE